MTWPSRRHVNAAVFLAANSASSSGLVSVTVRSVLHSAVAGKWISAPLLSSTWQR
jgi:hypothetical protein